MITYKQFIKEKFKMKKDIENILKELNHENYYLNMNAKRNNSDVIHITWFKEKAPIQIFEFRDKFEDRFRDKYILEQNKDKTEYFLIKQD